MCANHLSLFYINESYCLFLCLSQICVSHLPFVFRFVHFFIQKMLISV